jgi:peptidoglycan/LPS O-acetylase OafA/YrhL
MKTKGYLPFIDGLRALAVFPVVFFHANFKYFEGGFVGVDIFFVISGFLITQLIIKDLEKNKFNLFSFYIRRARRILPILFFVILTTIFLSILLMNSTQLNLYVNQVFSVILFISNFFFWQNSGYFDPNTEIQPLLHTWSLAVEEQFYIFFPIFLLFVFKFFRKKILQIIIFIIIMSFLLSQIGGNFKYQNISLSYPFFSLPFDFFWQAGSANFYLPFGRAWELLIGSLIAIYFKKIKNYNQNYCNYFSLIGLIFILFSIFFYSNRFQYPSIYTVLPCLGTALIIIYTNKKTFLFKILTSRPLVQLGLISYSFYLWHQPMFAFSRIQYGTDLTIIISLFLIIISLFLSVFSWKYIEQPFRDRKKIKNNSFLIILSIFLLSIISVLSLIKNEKIKSFQAEIPNEIKKTMEFAPADRCIDIENAHKANTKNWFCYLGNKDTKKKISFAVIGDSHAHSMIPLFREIAKKNNLKGILTGFSGCPGIIGVQSIRFEKTKNCKLLANKFHQFVKDESINKIFLVSRWTYYTDGRYNGRQFQLLTENNNLFSNKENSRTALINGLTNTVDMYNQIGTKVVFVHQAPLQIFDPQFIYSESFDKITNRIRIDKLKNYSVDLSESLNFQKFIRDNVKILKDQYSNLITIDLNDYFCDVSKCLVGNEKASYYADDDHLSIYGSKFLIDKFEEFIK